jgi:hypothetical protein
MAKQATTKGKATLHRKVFEKQQKFFDTLVEFIKCTRKKPARISSNPKCLYF